MLPHPVHRSSPGMSAGPDLAGVCHSFSPYPSLRSQHPSQTSPLSQAKIEGMGDTSEADLRECTRRKKKANKEKVKRDDQGSGVLCKPKEKFRRGQGAQQSKEVQWDSLDSTLGRPLVSSERVSSTEGHRSNDERCWVSEVKTVKKFSKEKQRGASCVRFKTSRIWGIWGTHTMLGGLTEKLWTENKTMCMSG